MTTHTTEPAVPADIHESLAVHALRSYADLARRTFGGYGSAYIHVQVFGPGEEIVSASIGAGKLARAYSAGSLEEAYRAAREDTCTATQLKRLRDERRALDERIAELEHIATSLTPDTSTQ